MYEVIESWPWYDRAIAGAFITMVVFGPILIIRQLGRIADLLVEIRNQQRPPYE